MVDLTDPQTHKHTNKQTGAITIHCAAVSQARSVMICCYYSYGKIKILKVLLVNFGHQAAKNVCR